MGGVPRNQLPKWLCSCFFPKKISPTFSESFRKKNGDKKKTKKNSSWWLNQPIWKICEPSNWVPFPPSNFRGENFIQKIFELSCTWKLSCPYNFPLTFNSKSSWRNVPNAQADDIPSNKKGGWLQIRFLDTYIFNQLLPSRERSHIPYQKRSFESMIFRTSRLVGYVSFLEGIC